MLTLSSSLENVYNSKTYYSSNTSHAYDSNGLLKTDKVWSLIQNIINTPHGVSVAMPTGISHTAP